MLQTYGFQNNFLKEVPNSTVILLEITVEANFKTMKTYGYQRLTPIILATQEAEIRRIAA
jgi:hypothetical protein